MPSRRPSHSRAAPYSNHVINLRLLRVKWIRFFSVLYTGSASVSKDFIFFMSTCDLHVHMYLTYLVTFTPYLSLNFHHTSSEAYLGVIDVSGFRALSSQNLIQPICLFITGNKETKQGLVGESREVLSFSL